MEIVPEVVQPQNPAPADHPQDPIVPTPTPPKEVVSISKEEFEDLQFRASQSSQNFERLKDATNRVKELETLLDPALSDPSSNDGVLAAQVAELAAKQTQREIIDEFPALKDLWSDFESFQKSDENKGMAPKVAAKAFLIEKGLVESPRMGLEDPTGGSRIPPTPGMKAEDIKKLRETDYKKYLDLVKKGLIKIS